MHYTLSVSTPFAVNKFTSAINITTYYCEYKQRVVGTHGFEQDHAAAVLIRNDRSLSVAWLDCDATGTPLNAEVELSFTRSLLQVKLKTKTVIRSSKFDVCALYPEHLALSKINSLLRGSLRTQLKRIVFTLAKEVKRFASPAFAEDCDND